MKKFLCILGACLLFLCTTGCASKEKATSVEISPGVEFSLTDVLKVENDQANTVFYYFLGTVDNKSDSTYHMSNLHYVMTDASMLDDKQGIQPIDKSKTIITNDVQKDMSTFVCGYIGVPQTKYKDLGLFFPNQDVFLPFDGIQVRSMNDEAVTNSTDPTFTIYEDEYFAFDVDSSNLTYRYEDGTSLIEGLVIHYINKTDQKLVVPYLTPVCTIDGLDLNSLPNGPELLAMSQEEIEAQNFSTSGMDARTTSYTAEASNYKILYLLPDQDIPLPIAFRAKGIIPDFSSHLKNGITISIKSPALGYSQVLKVNY